MKISVFRGNYKPPTKSLSQQSVNTKKKNTNSDQSKEINSLNEKVDLLLNNVEKILASKTVINSRKISEIAKEAEEIKKKKEERVFVPSIDSETVSNAKINNIKSTKQNKNLSSAIDKLKSMRI